MEHLHGSAVTLSCTTHVLTMEGENAFKSWAKIVDCGDVRMTFLDNTVALKQLDKAHQTIAGRTTATPEKGKVPRIVVLGGDHTTTLSALKSTYEKFGAISVIHFDSHLDTYDPKVLGRCFAGIYCVAELMEIQVETSPLMRMRITPFDDFEN